MATIAIFVSFLALIRYKNIDIIFDFGYYTIVFKHYKRIKLWQT